MKIKEHGKGAIFEIMVGDNDFQAGTIWVRDDIMFDEKKSRGWKINWSAIGSVDVKTTKKFREALDKAIEIAEKKGRL